jgi:predicted dinucleotide-binding enzyme
MTYTLGLIGAGNIGSAISRLAVAAGLRVVVSSNDEEQVAGLVAELGDLASGASPEEAARAGDIVVACIPFANNDQLPSEALAGKVVIDTSNYYPELSDRVAELEESGAPSSTLTQQHLSDSHVVKAFNTIDFARIPKLARPVGASDRSAMAIAGDDAEAKAQAAELIGRLGFDVVDAGVLAESWRLEPGMPVYVSPYLPARPTDLDEDASIAWYFDAPGVPVTADRVHELVAAAIRVAPGSVKVGLGD